MAFTQATFAPVAANSTEAPSFFKYKTNDTLAQVAAADYFEDKEFQLKEDDFMNISAQDGFAIANVNADQKSVTLTFS